MAQQITSQASAPHQDHEMDPMRSWPPALRKLNEYGGVVVGWIQAPVSDADKLWISNRLDQIDMQLRATDDREDAAKAIVGLLAIYPSNTTSDQAKLRVSAYMAALDDRPAWSIKVAARRWLKGDVEVSDLRQLDFAPLPAALRRLATDAVTALEKERDRLKLISTAKVRVETRPQQLPEKKYVDIERVNKIREEFGLQRM